MTDLRRLLDRQEIEDLLVRYARAVDRGDWDLLRSVYHPDAYDDHGGYRGGVEGFIAYVTARHRDLEHSAHHLSNIYVEFVHDDCAVVETHCQAFQRFGPGPQRMLAFGDDPQIVAPGSAGASIRAVLRYVDRVERRGGVWAIAHRTVVSGEVSVEQLDSPVVFGPERVVQRHDMGDYLYRALAEARARPAPGGGGAETSRPWSRRSGTRPEDT